jgi:signal transduction histidine kinase
VTRLFLHVGRFRLRVILALLGCTLFFGLATSLGFRAYLGLSDELVHEQVLTVGGLFALVFAVLAVFSWRYLAPVSSLLRTLMVHGIASAPAEARARHAVLRFPQVIVQVTIVTALVAVASGVWLDLRLYGLPPRLVAGMAVGSLSVALVACTFVYVITRAMVRPIAIHFRQEEVPSGIRVSVKSKIVLAIVALALASAVPFGTICARRIHLLGEAEQLRNARHLAEAIAYGGTALTSTALRDAVAAAALEDAHVRFSDRDGPGASPLPAGHIAPYVAVELRRTTVPDHTILTLLVVAALALSIFVATLLGRDLARDVARLAARIAAIGSRRVAAQQPIAAAIPQFSDLRALSAAVSELLIRTAEIHVTQFVAIEKTLAADRVKMQFLANVSHDLRSPLNAVLGFSELLLRDTQGPLEERTRTALLTIQRAGSELLHLIDEVLDLAKLEAGRISLSREDSMPALLVHGAIQEVRRVARPETRIETELQAGLPTIWVDPHRLQQAIQHLLRFSVQNLGAGEISVRVRCEPIPEPQRDGAKRMLLIRIADTGRGLEGDEVGQLFIGFRRKSGVRGLGLGVPLAKALLEMHGGTLQVFSAPGVGTTFAADLPVLQRKVLGKLRPVPV